MKNINIRKFYYLARHRYMTTNNLVITVALLIAFSWAWGSVGVMERNYTLQREINTKQQQLKLAQLETDTDKFEQKYYQSDEYKELAVRQRLGLVAPGEKILILPANSAAAKNFDASQQPKTSNAPVDKPGNAAQWINFLFGGNERGLQQ